MRRSAACGIAMQWSWRCNCAEFAIISHLACCFNAPKAPALRATLPFPVPGTACALSAAGRSIAASFCSPHEALRSLPHRCLSYVRACSDVSVFHLVVNLPAAGRRYGRGRLGFGRADRAVRTCHGSRCQPCRARDRQGSLPRHRCIMQLAGSCGRVNKQLYPTRRLLHCTCGECHAPPVHLSHGCVPCAATAA